MKMSKAQAAKGFVVSAALAAGVFAVAWLWNSGETLSYSSEGATSTVAAVAVPEVPKLVVTHLPTPESVKAIYMTSWVAGRKDLRANLVKIIDETEINAVVIDIKDYTGNIAFEVENPLLAPAVERRISDIKEFIAALHEKDIYVIGRISVFQDQYLTAKRPDLAVRRKTADAPWADRKGIRWLDAGSREVWDYAVAVAKESYAVGFDELNFDYIRFPSDGNMKDVSYRFYDETRLSKSDQIAEFFAYLDRALADIPAATSADLFGMVTSNTDDLGIGQVLEKALPHFDYIAPMVYPSHYPPGFNGYKNPAAVPYEIIKYSMGRAKERAIMASTTPDKLRAWLQDFDLGADYTAELVRAQITALDELGLDSWMIWAPSNKYTVGALKRD